MRARIPSRKKESKKRLQKCAAPFVCLFFLRAIGLLQIKDVGWVGGGRGQTKKWVPYWEQLRSAIRKEGRQKRGTRTCGCVRAPAGLCISSVENLNDNRETAVVVLILLITRTRPDNGSNDNA